MLVGAGPAGATPTPHGRCNCATAPLQPGRSRIRWAKEAQNTHKGLLVCRRHVQRHRRRRPAEPRHALIPHIQASRPHGAPAHLTFHKPARLPTLPMRTHVLARVRRVPVLGKTGSLLHRKTPRLLPAWRLHCSLPSSVAGAEHPATAARKPVYLLALP